MADPIVSTVIAPAAGSLIGAVAVSLGVPVPVVMAAVIGSTLAALTTHRAEWSVKSVQASLVAFVMALAFGIFIGPVAALAAVAVAAHLPASFAFDLPAKLADPACSLLLSLLGQKELLPLLSRKLRSETAQKGGESQ